MCHGKQKGPRKDVNEADEEEVNGQEALDEIKM